MKNYIISGVIALVVAVFVGVLTPEPVKTIIEKQLGALAGPDIPSPYLQWGGVHEWRASISLNTGTTTVCSLQSPAATSTLMSASARFDTSSSTATQLYMVKSTASSGTTTGATMLAYTTAAASQVGVVLGTVASSTAGAAALAGNIAGGFVFAPNTFLNVAMAGGIGTFSPTGECKAVWLQN